MDVRRAVAVRLKSEMERKGLSRDGLAHAANISIDIVDSYLAGRRELRFDELGPICDALVLRLMRLIAPSFETPHLQYRTTGAQDRRLASEIENAFLTVADLLPRPKTISGTQSISERDNDIFWLISEVRGAVESLRQIHPRVEDLYSVAELPILPICAGVDGFDAFLLSHGRQFVVCVNRDKPPVRIHFSLLHEMAHYLFHRGRNIPVDILGDDYYADVIRAEAVPEYVANKFAQQYLFSFDEADRLAPRWRQLQDVAAIIAERRTTPEVLANAIYDSLRMRPGCPRYVEVRDHLKAVAGTGWGDRTILDFVERSGDDLKRRVLDMRDEFAEDVWESVARAWEIEYAQ